MNYKLDYDLQLRLFSPIRIARIESGLGECLGFKKSLIKVKD